MYFVLLRAMDRRVFQVLPPGPEQDEYKAKTPAIEGFHGKQTDAPFFGFPRAYVFTEAAKGRTMNFMADAKQLQGPIEM